MIQGSGRCDMHEETTELSESGSAHIEHCLPFFVSTNRTTMESDVSRSPWNQL